MTKAQQLRSKLPSLQNSIMELNNCWSISHSFVVFMIAFKNSCPSTTPTSVIPPLNVVPQAKKSPLEMFLLPIVPQRLLNLLQQFCIAMQANLLARFHLIVSHPWSLKCFVWVCIPVWTPRTGPCLRCAGFWLLVEVLPLLQGYLY